jgi:hypothetical protein
MSLITSKFRIKGGTDFLSLAGEVYVAPKIAGYAAGGITTVNVATVDKFAFSNDARSTLATGLSFARRLATGFASDVAGYAAGGSAGSDVATVEKFAFSDDSRSTLGTGISSTRWGSAGFASGVAGYVAGGFSGILDVATVDKFAFSDDSRTTLATGLSLARRLLAGFASDVAGYAAGGLTSVSFATVDKFAFSDDSRTTLATGLSETPAGVAGFASDVAGYAAGGYRTGVESGPVATVDKFAFADDSRTTLAAGLSSARDATTGFASDVAGYAAGGRTGTFGAQVVVDAVDKFAFSDDSRTTLATGLSSARWGLAGFAG